MNVWRSKVYVLIFIFCHELNYGLLKWNNIKKSTNSFRHKSFLQNINTYKSKYKIRKALFKVKTKTNKKPCNLKGPQGCGVSPLLIFYSDSPYHLYTKYRIIVLVSISKNSRYVNYYIYLVLKIKIALHKIINHLGTTAKGDWGRSKDTLGLLPTGSWSFAKWDVRGVQVKSHVHSEFGRKNPMPCVEKLSRSQDIKNPCKKTLRGIFISMLLNLFRFFFLYTLIPLHMFYSKKKSCPLFSILLTSLRTSWILLLFFFYLHRVRDSNVFTEKSTHDRKVHLTSSDVIDFFHSELTWFLFKELSLSKISIVCV